ncbi:MAG: hypothetical protein PHY30_00410 [Candidatus Pacebacteria bacterium]|nr:hypothetical protein [Candidatus Paceibacterota bacterium]
MPFKKIFILIIVCTGAIYIYNEKNDLLVQVFDKLNIEDNNASVLEKVQKTIRIYNGHPKGESLSLKENTKLLSRTDDVVYTTKEPIIIPGMKNGEPGYVDAIVETLKKEEKQLDENPTITIPGLNSTEYFDTTWAEIVDDENREKEKTKETFVNGIIEKDTIWEIKNSPYIVNGNIFIKENTTLLIEPGVEIKFNGDYGFLIEGELKMIGKKKSPIKILNDINF